MNFATVTGRRDFREIMPFPYLLGSLTDRRRIHFDRTALYPILATHFIEKHDERRKKNPSLAQIHITPRCTELFKKYEWRGNATLVEQESQAVSDYLERMHQDILRNFDTRVRKFRRKRKIILSDRALKDLL